MPLPQKVIEQLGREPPKTPGWSGQLLMFSSTVFLISLFIYIGLVFGYRSYLLGEVKKAQNQIQAFSQQIPAEEQARLVDFYSQLTNLKSILASHVFSSQIFDWLERNTEANVYFTKFNLAASRSQLTLGGVAKTMEDAAQQIAVFEAQPELEKVSVGGVSFANGVWQFDLNLIFKTGYFQRPSSPAP